MSDDPDFPLASVLTVIAAAPAGTVRWPEAVRRTGSLAALAAATRQEWAALGLGGEAHAALTAGPEPGRFTTWCDWLAAPGHDLIPLGSARYPPLLAALRDSPLALWVDGARPDLLTGPQLAIVGSRQASVGGLATARGFARTLGTAGVTITSGLAAGIDAAAHEGAIGTIGGTIAVLGSGIDRVYPRRHAALAGRLRADGVIVSEYPPGSAPKAHHFPERNRIIAGLALGTLVVEAARRSGSLITARLAGEYGREVFAVPGSIHSTLSRGCHRLLRQGACLVESVADILAEIAPPLARAVADNVAAARSEDEQELEPAARKLLNRLDFSPVAITALATDAGLTTTDVSSMLLHLEMAGMVEALPGGRYRRLEKRIR